MTRIPNQFAGNTQLIRDAYARGLIDPSLCVDSLSYKMMLAMHRSQVPRTHINNIDQNSEALRTQVHTFGRTPVFDANSDHLIELARVGVPDGYIGYLEHIEQYMADAVGAFYATSSQFWGMPYNETVDVDSITWLMQLDSYNVQLQPRFYITSPVMGDFRSLLPGYGWRELPEFNGIWYPATQRNGIRGLIPSGKTLRMFAFVQSSDLSIYSWRLSGRLTARVQVEQCPEALQNTRTTFQ